MEEQVLLRVPPVLATRLRDLIQGNATTTITTTNATITSSATSNNGNNTTSSVLSASSTGNPGHTSSNAVHLTFSDDRLCQLQLDGGATVYNGALVNLPCQIEIHKTFDHLSYFKAADIAQMIIIEDPEVASIVSPNITDSASASTSTTTSSSHSLTKKSRVWPPPFNYPSGLLPPTRDIRPRRFERDTIVPKRVVSEVESMLHQIKENQPIHTIKLIEEEVEIEIDDYDQLIPPITPGLATQPQFSPNPPLTNLLTHPSISFATPQSPHEMQLASPMIVVDDLMPQPMELSTTALALETTGISSPSAAMDAIATSSETAMEEITEPAVLPATESEDVVKLRAEIAEIDRRLEETSNAVNKAVNRIVKQRATEKLTAVQAERDAKQKELDAALTGTEPST